MRELVLRNARLVLSDRVVHGSVRIRDGLIADIAEGVHAAGEDMEGDWVIPGIVELHTDHLEKHYAPRPGVRWNPLASVQAHDALVVSSGITTVCDALRCGFEEGTELGGSDMRLLGDAITHAMSEGRLRADHFIHLRCEVSADDVMSGFEMFENDPRVLLASVMDHTPGQRQFGSLDHFKAYYLRTSRKSEAEYHAMLGVRLAMAERNSARHRREIVARCLAAGKVLASHDDATRAHVAEAVDHGITIAEFPTTLEAAEASREAGLSILMGAPNVVRGGSHTGNIAAIDLWKAGLMDILSSDYVPYSLLHAVFLAAGEATGITLPQAVACITANPARAAHLDDRGRIETGLRGDLVRVRVDHEVPLVRGVWRLGERIN